MATQMGKGPSRLPIERFLAVVYDDVWWTSGSWAYIHGLQSCPGPASEPAVAAQPFRPVPPVGLPLKHTRASGLRPRMDPKHESPFTDQEHAKQPIRALHHHTHRRAIH